MTRAKETGGMIQTPLLCKREILSSNSSPTKKQKTKNERNLLCIPENFVRNWVLFVFLSEGLRMGFNLGAPTVYNHCHNSNGVLNGISRR
jgi:hypothetical protein